MEQYEGFHFHTEWIEDLSALPDEKQLAYYQYISNYGAYGTEPEGLSGMEKFAWDGIKYTIDRDREDAARQKEEQEIRHRNGKRGGRPKKTTGNKLDNLPFPNDETIVSDSKNIGFENKKPMFSNKKTIVSEKREETSLMGSQGSFSPKPPYLPNSPLTLLEERELSPRACAREETDTDPEKDVSDPGQAEQGAGGREETEEQDSPTEQNVLSADEEEKKKDPADEINSLFDAFWQEYPKKVAKKEARRVFARIHPDLELTQTMIRAVQAQSESRQWQDPKFIPNPSTWLNQERWNDEMESEPENASFPRAGPERPEQDGSPPSYDPDLFRKKAVAPLVYHRRSSPPDESPGESEQTP